MSAKPATRRALKTTVAALAVGAVTLAPMAPAAFEVGPGGAPFEIRYGAAADYTRMEFAGVVGARSRVRQEGRTVIVRMGVTAAPDVSRLKVDPPRGVESVETRAVQGGTELVITLAEGAVARSGVADGAVWLNLYAPGAAAPQAEAPDGRAAPGPVAVTARGSEDRAVLTFAWDRPVGAAVFRRGETVWVVFDAAARLDLSGARALGPAQGVQWAAGPDYVAVRIKAPRTVAVSASAQGSDWIVTLGGAAMTPAPVTVSRDPEGEPRLVAQMAGATRTVWLTDPEAGDRFAAVTALAPGKGFADERRTRDMTLIPTAQGLAVETPADDLTIVAAGDLVTVSRPRGLILSPPTAETEAAEAASDAPRRARFPALILGEWTSAPDGFIARRRTLQDAASEEAAKAEADPRVPIEARLAYARFLVASGLGYEAIGVLNAIIEAQPGMLGEPEVRGLRGAARASVGRIEEAAADFSGASLSGDPATRVWQGYVAARRGQWEEARRAFAAGAPAIDDFPTEWRARFATAHAEATLAAGDLESTRALTAYVFSLNAAPAEQLAARVVQARLFETEGQTARALAVYQAVARAPLDQIAVPAALGAIRLQRASGALSPTVAAQQLEVLRWRWRGDRIELDVVRALGELYLSQGLYREALTALRGVNGRLAQLPEAADLQADLQRAFRYLFLEGGADGMQPIQALGLFFDFRELTPVGADGEEMVRRLARRLIDVDLLDQAAELLQYQVDNRLEGVARASIATDLATVYLMDRQPEQALQALWTTRTTLLPSALQAERRALEARALMQLGRYDHALEIIESDRAPAAREVRAEVFWKQEKWGEAAALYEQVLGDRWRDASTPLSPQDETRLIRAGVGYSLARDDAAVARLSRNWSPFIDRARAPDALRIALAGPTAPARDFATLAASTDAFAGWVSGMRNQFRQRTGGSRAAAAPARNASAPAAAPRAAAG